MKQRDIYQESIGGHFVHLGKKYSLNKLLALVHEYKVVDYPADSLKWILDYSQQKVGDKVYCNSCRKGPEGWHEERVEKSDLTAPLIITFSDDKPVVLDGVHRLEKALRLNLKTIPVKVVEENLLKICK